MRESVDGKERLLTNEITRLQIGNYQLDICTAAAISRNVALKRPLLKQKSKREHAEVVARLDKITLQLTHFDARRFTEADKRESRELSKE